MKSIFRMSIMLLLACSLHSCQDIAYESVEADIKARAKLKNQTKAKNDKHVFTISHVAPEYTSPYEELVIWIGGEGSITVDWGDGTSSTYDLGDGLSSIDMTKRYDSAGRYLISITGDLKNITRFGSSYGQGPFDDINLRPLTGLQVFSISNFPGPEVIDLSHNKKLRYLSLHDISGLREIKLPKQHSLSGVSVAASTDLTPATVDALINSVYKNAIKEQIFDGYFHVTVSPFYDGTTEMVGPPSEDSIALLTELLNAYNWQVYP